MIPRFFSNLNDPVISEGSGGQWFVGAHLALLGGDSDHFIAIVPLLKKSALEAYSKDGERLFIRECSGRMRCKGFKLKENRSRLSNLEKSLLIS